MARGVCRLGRKALRDAEHGGEQLQLLLRRCGGAGVEAEGQLDLSAVGDVVLPARIQPWGRKLPVRSGLSATELDTSLRLTEMAWWRRSRGHCVTAARGQWRHVRRQPNHADHSSRELRGPSRVAGSPTRPEPSSMTQAETLDLFESPAREPLCEGAVLLRASLYEPALARTVICFHTAGSAGALISPKSSGLSAEQPRSSRRLRGRSVWMPQVVEVSIHAAWRPIRPVAC